MKLEYLGHSCFRLTAQNGYQVVIDPYDTGSVPGVELIEPLMANAVYTTHNHGDHSAVHKVTLQETAIENPFVVETLEVPHDEEGGTLRGMNQIHIFTVDGLRLIHFGDLGRSLTSTEKDILKGVDVIMIPCGGYYTIGKEVARETIDALKPNLSILMHYRNDIFGFDVLEHIDRIRTIFPELKELDVSCLAIPSETGIITLKPFQETGK